MISITLVYKFLLLETDTSLSSGCDQRPFAHRLRQAVSQFRSQKTYLWLFQQTQMIAADLSQVHAATRHQIA